MQRSEADGCPMFRWGAAPMGALAHGPAVSAFVARLLLHHQDSAVSRMALLSLTASQTALAKQPVPGRSLRWCVGQRFESGKPIEIPTYAAALRSAWEDAARAPKAQQSPMSLQNEGKMIYMM